MQLLLNISIMIICSFQKKKKVQGVLKGHRDHWIMSLTLIITANVTMIFGQGSRLYILLCFLCPWQLNLIVLLSASVNEVLWDLQLFTTIKELLSKVYNVMHNILHHTEHTCI